MERWQNKVAVVTGASSGIGAACVRYLLNHGMIVVGLARRLERLENMRSKLSKEQQERFHFRHCDVSKEADIVEAFAWIESELNGVHVLINNAGANKIHSQLTMSNNSEDMRATIDTNVMGVVYCTREAFQSMKKRAIDGHVIIINSVVGHRVPIMQGVSMNIYPASKHAVTAITEVLRQEFLMNETRIKITSISPGAVDTEMMPSSELLPVTIPMLRSEDIADAVIYCIQTPPNVQIHEMIIKPIGEIY